jgi:hypothetical protein
MARIKTDEEVPIAEENKNAADGGRAKNRERVVGDRGPSA